MDIASDKRAKKVFGYKLAGYKMNDRPSLNLPHNRRVKLGLGI